MSAVLNSKPWRVLGAKASVRQPGVRWCNAVTRALLSFGVRYGDANELRVERPNANGEGWNLVLPRPVTGPVAPFTLLYDDDAGTYSVQPGPVYWRFHQANADYGSGTGWRLISGGAGTPGYIGATAISPPTPHGGCIYLKVVRTPGGGTADAFVCSIHGQQGNTAAAAEAAALALGSWSTFILPLALLSATGVIRQIHAGGARFQDEAPGTCKQWDSATAVPDGWEVVSEASGYYLLGATTSLGTTDPGSMTHNHGVTDPSHNHAASGTGVGLDKELLYAKTCDEEGDPPYSEACIEVLGGDTNLDLAIDTTTSNTTGLTVNNANAVPPWYKVALIRKL